MPLKCTEIPPRIDFRVLDEQFLPKGAKVPRFG